MALKNVEIDQNEHGTEAMITPKNLDFGGYQNLFEADTTRKYEPVKSKNNAQTILKQLQNNFEKSQNLLQKYASPARMRGGTTSQRTKFLNQKIVSTGCF